MHCDTIIECKPTKCPLIDYRAHPSTCWTDYISAWKTYHKKLYIQMVFLMKNTWSSKHVENTKN